MSRWKVPTYSHSTRLKNLFQNIGANIRQIGSDVSIEVSLSGERYWHRNSVLHREDGPAVIEADGSKQWYRDGRLHRIDGPAIEMADGSKSWFQNGQLHREDGPAVENANGRKSWHEHGLRLSPPNGPDELS